MRDAILGLAIGVAVWWVGYALVWLLSAEMTW